MDDGRPSSPSAMPAAIPYSAMDLDYIDDLLLEGCWLETTCGPELPSDSPFSPSSFFDASFLWPNIEATNGGSNLLHTTPLPKDPREERQRSSVYENLSTSKAHEQNTNKSGNDLVGGSDLSRRLWIGPTKTPSPGSSVVDRLIGALSCIRESTKNKDSLIQIWVPMHGGGRQFLTTNNQPFSLDLTDTRLARFREISINYQFPTEENAEEIAGLPGRVFKGKVPEWTPDVRFFRSDEYARVAYARQWGVCGTLGLPIFEQGSQDCLGVIEVAMTAQKTKYLPEIENVCKALEAVDLRTSDALGNQNVEICNGSYQAALPEILEVLKSACETHKLPLAQMWVPCVLQGKGGCRHSDENYVHCVSTLDSACYVRDPQMRAFHEACSEHHLLKGEGIVGQAFMTNQPCFSSDITSFSKTEYPLSHHAKMFNLHAAVSIRLRSMYTGKNDFVLEFFLPVDSDDLKGQKDLLTSLSGSIQKTCRSLCVVTDKELEEGKSFPFEEVISEVSSVGDPEPGPLGNASLKRKVHLSFHPESLTGVGERGERRRAKSEKTITLDVLRQYFAGSLKDAAKSVGVCPTTLKRICRQHGIKRWPSRKIKKVGHSLEKIKRVVNSVQVASGALQIESLYSNFPERTSPKSSKSSPFSTSKLCSHHKVKSKLDTLTPRAEESTSSSSCSQCYSSGTQPNLSPLYISSGDNPITKEDSSNSVLKGVRSEIQIKVSKDEVVPNFLLRSRSHNHPTPASVLPIPKSDGENRDTRGVGFFRIKVAYGEEKIRLRFHNAWNYETLREEIARRFGVADEMDGLQLKYLDDESEWVLLTCNDDWGECVDLHGPARTSTIKLSLSQITRKQSGTSLSTLGAS